MISLAFRAREWMAEHFRWAQFPRQQVLPKRARPPFFRYGMPWEMRALLVLVGIVLILIATAALGALLLLFYSALTA